MQQKLAMLALVVDEYDKAIAFYTGSMNFELLEDTSLSAIKRWVVVKPKGTDGCRILLARAVNEEQESRIGNQTGGRVFLFLHTDDVDRDFERYKANGLRPVREPSDELFGRVAVVEDLYGNLWDLIQPKALENNQ